VSDPEPDAIGPVPSTERITLIDCLRGAALFGILMANMRGFNAPLAAYMRPDLMWTSLPDRVTQALVDCFISGKFITIFAALFGVGFAIQMERAMARNGSITFYGRRLAALFAIGLAHALLVWWGDILTNYAICGFFLVALRNASQRAVLAWAHALYWFVLLLFTGVYIATLFGMPLPPEEDRFKLQEVIQAYAHGTVRDVFTVRAHEWLEANSFLIILTRVLGVFLFGLYIWRQGYLRRPSEHLEWWNRAQRLGFPIGLIGNAIAVALEWRYHPDPEEPGLVSVVMFACYSVGVPALSLAYSATLVRLWQDPVWQSRLTPFSYIGRMALTNYLLQSVIFTTIFYSYGLGLYGRVGPLLNVPLAIAVYSLQVRFSMWWLNRHRYGPMEWLWRWMTYGRSGFGVRDPGLGAF
jgi:uncharacterized protein